MGKLIPLVGLAIRVGKGGLEPPRLSTPDPKSGPSANSGTPPTASQIRTQPLKELTNDILSTFLASRRQGISKYTILFYQRCLNRATGIELTPEGVNDNGLL